MPFTSIEMVQFSTGTPVDNPVEKSGCTEEFWYSTRRCLKCGQYYTEADNQDSNTRCQYHPGIFREPTRISEGPLVGWSCCKNKGNTNEYLNRNSPGCRSSEKHIEDTDYSEIMKAFPFDPKEEEIHRLKQKEAKEFCPMPPKLEEMKQHSDYFPHYVTSTDTLAGLSLKYNLPPSKIKQINRLHNDSISHREVIYLPKTAESQGKTPGNRDTEDDKICLFAFQTGCVREESKFYLEEANWDVNKALEDWKSDVAWSKTSAKPHS